MFGLWFEEMKKGEFGKSLPPSSEKYLVHDLKRWKKGEFGNSLPPLREEYFVYDIEQDCVNIRCEYLENALEISSESGDGDIFLLIPDVVFENGEWEAWHMGSKLPGANRYRSFYELMEIVLRQGAFIT